VGVFFPTHSETFRTSIDHSIFLKVLLLVDQILVSFKMRRIAVLPHPTRDRRGPLRVLFTARSSWWVHELPRMHVRSRHSKNVCV
jgi:hypothetical protein